MSLDLPVAQALVAALYLAAAAGCSVAVGLRVSRALASDDALLRALVALSVGLAQGIGVPLVLSMLGVLSRGSVLALHAAVAAVCFAIARRVEAVAAAPCPVQTTRRRRIGAAGIAAVACGAALATLAALPTLRAIASLHHETRHYHITNLVHWLEGRSFWTLPFQNPGLFTATHPGNGEMLGLWLALATHGDQLIYLMPIPFAALAALAFATLARDLGAPAGPAALVAVAFLAAPGIYATQAHSLATDFVATGGMAAAAAFALRARRTGALRWFALTGVALGIALGGKYTAILPAAAVAGWSVIALRPRRHLLVAVAAVAAFAGPWYARNWATTGNPVFPQEVRLGGRVVFAGGESPVARLATPIASHLIHGRWDVLQRWSRLVWTFYGPLLPLAALGVAAAVARARRRAGLAAVTGLALVAAITYAVTPYTGAGLEGVTFLMGSNLRYALLAVLLGLVAAAVALPGWIAAGTAGISIVAGLVRIGQGSPRRPDLAAGDLSFLVAALAAAAAAAAAGGRLRPRLTERRIRLSLAAGVAVLGLAGFLAVGRPVRGPTPLEAAILRVRGAGPVIVLGVDDIRSVLGPDLGTTLSTVAAGGAAGEAPFRDPAALNRALDRSSARVLVVRPESEGLSVPRGWRPPPEWEPVANTLEAVVYVRTPPTPPTPSPTPPQPSTPPPPVVPTPPGG